MTSDQIDIIEANLKRLSTCMPDVPIEGILLMRLLLFLGHQLGMVLDHLIRPFGLSEGEFRVLTALFSQPDGTSHPGELCSRASQSPANMSRIGDALVNRGLITRDTSARDRRRMVLRITDQGTDLVRGLLPTMFLPLREFVTVLSDPEQRQLIGLLKRMAVKVDEVRW